MDKGKNQTKASAQTFCDHDQGRSMGRMDGPQRHNHVGGAETDPDRTAVALEALRRLKGIDLEANPAVKAAVLKVLDQIRGKPQFVEIVRDFKIKGQGPALLEIAIQNPGNATGVDAVRLLLENQHAALLM